jgi:hypothetical protein
MATTPYPSTSPGLRALAWTAPLAAVAASIVVGMAFLFPAGPATSKPFMAGKVDDFAPGSVSYFEQQNFYLVRSEAGDFTAFYDLDPYQQARPGLRPQTAAWSGTAKSSGKLHSAPGMAGSGRVVRATGMARMVSRCSGPPSPISTAMK